MLLEYPSLNHDQKLFIKRHTYVYNWCQDTICFQLVSSHNWFSKGSLIEGEQDFKFHGSSNISLWRWSRYGYVSLNEFFMSFSINSKSFKNSYFWTHNHPPSWIEGERENCSKISEKIKPDHTSLPKLFPNLFKSIEIQNLKGFDIFDQGRECDLNKKSDKKWSFWTQ